MRHYDWESEPDSTYDDFLDEQELRLRGERARRTDEADGFFETEKEE
jgi:hypothetical protein